MEKSPFAFSYEIYTYVPEKSLTDIGLLKLNFSSITLKILAEIESPESNGLVNNNGVSRSRNPNLASNLFPIKTPSSNFDESIDKSNTFSRYLKSSSPTTFTKKALLSNDIIEGLLIIF